MIINDSSAEHTRINEVYRQRAAAIPASRYSPFNIGQLYLVQRQDREVLLMLRAEGWDQQRLGQARIFEVGCGSGDFLRNFVRWGADPARLAGCDLRADAIAHGQRISPNLRLLQADAAHTAEPAGGYDIVFQNTMLSSVKDAGLRAAIAAEMQRLTKPDGLIFSCDLRYPNPRNREVVPLTRPEIRQLFPGRRISYRRPILLIPTLARPLARVSYPLCDLLNLLPLLRGHWLLGLRTKQEHA